jgi:hypothetical protein
LRKIKKAKTFELRSLIKKNNGENKKRITLVERPKDVR